ncbi:unnamed protein product [Cochlearia groenlandica]
MADYLEKATSALDEAKTSVTTTAETVGDSLTDAQKTVAESTETIKTDAEKTVAATSETVKTEAAASAEKAATTKEKMTTQARDAVDNALSKGIAGAKNFLNVFEEKRTEVSSKLVGAVTNVVGGGASSSTVATRDLPVSTDNQPLLSGERGAETTPWWKNCCGVLDLLKTSTTSSSTTTTTK